MSMSTQPAAQLATIGSAEVIADYRTYAEAQHLVDRLSDAKFPVEHVRIVGSGMHSVEQVTGRVTVGRATLMGLGGGAWFGLLIGLLFSLFSVGPVWFAVVLGSTAFGAAWGAVFGAVAHGAAGGRRDFSSVQSLVADRYRVEVDAGFAPEALRLSSLSA